MVSTRSTASSISYNARPHQPASLARRLLFPQIQPGSDLPSLFLSPACPPELNDEVYDLVALALRAFVNTWWTKLSRYDREFLPQITSIVTHVVRSLEQRVLDADLALLVFVDFPALITQHYRDHRQAASKASTSYATGGALSLPQLFHQLQPHMAVSPDGAIDEEYFRQVFDHVLRECLPSEDYASEPERFIVREILLKIVIKDVVPRVTEPWFLQKAVLDMLGPRPDVAEQPAGHAGVSKSSLIVILLSAIQRISGACITLIHTYKQVIHIIPILNRTQTSVGRSATAGNAHTNVLPDLARGPLDMISEVLHARDRLAATALVHFASLFCFAFPSFMNKLLCYLLHRHVLSATSVLHAVRLSKRTLFPNGYPAPAPTDPTAEEQAGIREGLVERLGVYVSGGVAAGVAAGLGDAACNRHLAVFLLDALVLCLFPEMG